MDIFEKRVQNLGPLGMYASRADGYFMFPKLEGEISNRMKFRGKDVLVWSLNNYLGLANHPEVREADAQASLRATQKRLGNIVNDAGLEIRQVNLGAKGTWYRVVLPTSSFQTATQTCASMKAQGVDCVAIKG